MEKEDLIVKREIEAMNRKGVICILSALAFGLSMIGFFQMGKQYVIDNAIVHDEHGSQGTYKLELDSKTYYYWYE